MGEGGCNGCLCNKFKVIFGLKGPRCCDRLEFSTSKMKFQTLQLAFSILKLENPAFKVGNSEIYF